MTAKLIDGKKIASSILEDIKSKVKKLKIKPGLAVIIVGDDPASHMYVNMKEKKCNEIGFYSKVIRLDEKIVKEQDKYISEIEVIDEINRLNNDPKIHGMIVQLPLPESADESLVIDAILPHKDADGFNPINMGNLLIGKNMIVPATPKGMLKLIESTKVDLGGKHAVVIGRSNIVGKPIAILLQQKNCTVTMCHSRTKNLAHHTKQADILVAAVGKPNLITKDMVKPGAIVIDAGTNKVDGKLVGDVDFEEVKKVAGFITPNPGGVGPMTIAMLLENTLECMELQKRL